MTSVYFIGICGTAMATLAAMLKRQGAQVRGSDADAYPPMDRFLAAEGITPWLGYDADHLTDDIDVVVIGNALETMASMTKPPPTANAALMNDEKNDPSTIRIASGSSRDISMCCNVKYPYENQRNPGRRVRPVC